MNHVLRKLTESLRYTRRKQINRQFNHCFICNREIKGKFVKSYPSSDKWVPPCCSNTCREIAKERAKK